MSEAVQDQFSILAKLKKDAVAGIGLVAKVREKEVKDKETKAVIRIEYYIDLDKMGASLSVQMSKPMYQEMNAFLSKGDWIIGQSVLEYHAEISVESEAFTWAEGKAMTTSKYGQAFLTHYKKIS